MDEFVLLKEGVLPNVVIVYDSTLGGGQGILLTAYLKLLLAAPEDAAMKQQVDAVYDRYGR